MTGVDPDREMPSIAAIAPNLRIDLFSACPGVQVSAETTTAGHKRSRGGSSGTHPMLDFYFHATPNSMKVAVLLQELELPFTVRPIDIFKGEQHTTAFKAINPNAKVPAIVDDQATVFDSHAILLYLAEKHGAFLPEDRADYAAMLSWLQLVATGLSPFSGQAIHFLHYAPQQIPYAINRYTREVARHYAVLDERLGAARHLAGDRYTIADMALWGWAASAGYIFGADGLAAYPNVQRLMDEMAARPAIQRALAMKSAHTFKGELDDESRKAMFPQNEAQAA